jgi:hypothetical protein
LAFRRLSQIRMPERRTVFWIPFFAVIGIATLLRIPSATNPGLWVDEMFSIAMATGHSLEHPAGDAIADLGDYIEPTEPSSAARFRQYLRHESPPAGLARTVRAVKMSDTNPPLYYILLNFWTRWFGATDVAVRCFSLLCALACFPPLWSLGRKIGGKPVAWTACALFACSPRAIYYSTEARMYSLVWLLALALAWLSLALTRRGPRPWLLVSWILAGAAGLMTHYFFAFVATACWFWLFVHPGLLSRRQAIGIGVMTVLVIAPWYIQIPDTLSYWRVTAGWLDNPLAPEQMVIAPLLMGWSFVSASGVWESPFAAEWALVALYALLIIVVVRKNFPDLFSIDRQLLWAWVVAACVGPLIFDLLRGTNASLVARYALPGLPAGLLLVATATSWLSRKWQTTFVLLVLLAWTPGIYGTFAEPSRPWQPFPEISAELQSAVGSNDLIIVHSIPGGVLGVARYLKTDALMVSRVIRLHQRDTESDMQQLVKGRCGVAFVRVHDLDNPSPEEDWLNEHGRLERRVIFSDWARAEILYYELGLSNEKSGNRCPRMNRPVPSVRETLPRPVKHSAA